MSTSTTTNNPNDPSGFVTNPPSVTVKIHNTSQDTMNGKLGIVIQYNQDRGRYLVLLTESQQTVALKPDNLMKASMMEQMQAQYQNLRNNPQIQREITKYYNLVSTKLQPYGIKPEQAAIGFGVVLVLMIYLVGFTRILMTLSLILLLGVILAPDISTMTQHGNFNYQILISNFPSRCRAMMEESVPFLRGKITDKIAAGIVLIFVVLTVRMIVMPTPTNKPPPTPPVSATTTTTGAGVVGGTSLTIDEAYKLGFEDATNGEEFGASLPPRDLTGGGATTETADIGANANNNNNDFPNLQYDANDYMRMMQPPKPWYSKLGIWQYFSLFNIGRTVWEMGKTIEGDFDVQLAIANLQNADAMRLGLLGFSLYNVIKVFF